MSDYQTKIGKVKRLKEFFNKKTFEDCFENWCGNYLRYELNIDPDKSNIKASIQLSDYFESTDREMITVNNSVWLIENCERVDEDDSYCNLTEIDDNEYEFRTRFYDGGTYEGEMIRDEIERLKL